MMSKSRLFLMATAMTLAPVIAAAAPVQITITNNQAADGLYLTPLLTILHDGSHDTFDAGDAASPELEALAEGGVAGPEQARAQAAGHIAEVIASPGGFAGAPVIDPGETASITLDLDATANRYLSFLSMVIPSNDLFIGNDNPTAYEIFDSLGNFNAGTITVFSANIWDSGTEDNTNAGAAFNSAGGTATDTVGGVVSLAGDASILFGQGTANGTTVGSGTGAGDLLATIQLTAVPLPAALPLLAASLGLGGAMGRRRKT